MDVTQQMGVSNAASLSDSDVNALASLHSAAFGRAVGYRTARLRSHRVAAASGRPVVPCTFIARVDGDIVGSASLLEDDSKGYHMDWTPWLATVLVVPLFRRRGVARCLVNRVAEDAAAMGYPSLYLWTPVADGLQPMYETMGFEFVEGGCIAGSDVVFMRRTLAAPGAG